MLNLDTHILLHAVAGRLTPRERAALREERWSISAIVLWEIAKLAQLGRIEVDLHTAFAFSGLLSGRAHADEEERAVVLLRAVSGGEPEEAVEELGQRGRGVRRERRLDRLEAELAVLAVHRLREPVR
jgi:hypothetical protein